VSRVDLYVKARGSWKAMTMNEQKPTIEPAITFPYRSVMLVMLAMSALSLAGASATIATAQPVSTAVAAE
jgi:hypothetical protein